MTATQLRQQLYVVLGRIAESGDTVEVTHKNHTFRIVPEDTRTFTDRLVRHDTLLVPADELVASEPGDWQWSEDRNLDRLS
jgi:antitoxin (DNA-binding transcriptional repressor) of toxin-antitoxin stability system